MSVAARLGPWRAVRALAVRSRPFTQSATTTCPRAIIPRTTSSLLPRRFLTTDNNNTNNSSDSAAPPPPSTNPAATPESRLTPEIFATNFLNAEALAALEKAAAGEDQYGELEEGLYFEMPPRPKKHEQLQDRHDPLIHQLTRRLMRDGKLGKAERDVAMILNFLRTSPSPKLNPNRPLLPGAPPPSHLPLNPLLYLTLAIDSVAPLVRIKALKGQAGGGRALELPQPMRIRVRRRKAIDWIMDSVSRKPSRGSGRSRFPHRFAEEIVAIIEGRSGVWDKRNLAHRMGTAARANLKHPNATPGNRRMPMR